MKSWFSTLRRALTRPLNLDGIRRGKASGTLRNDLKRLYRPFRKNWRMGALSASAAAMATLITLPQPLITRQFIDRVLLDRQLACLPVVLLLTAGIVFSSLGLGILKEWFAKSFERAVNTDLQENLYAHLLKLPKAFFEEKETGYLLSRVQGDVSALRWFYSTTPLNLAVQILRFAGGLALLFSLEWRLTLLVLAWLPVASASTYFFSRRIHDLTDAHREQRDRSHGAMGESMGAVALIKSCTAEKRALRQLLSATKASEEMQMEQSALTQVSRIATQLGPTLAQIAVLCIGAYWVVAARGRWDRWSPSRPTSDVSSGRHKPWRG